MRKFIVNLFSNRFGIALATLNVCYFLSRPFFQRVFEHAHDENCIVIKDFFLFPMIISKIDDLMILQNLPATVASLIPHILMKEFLPDICVFTQVKIQIVFFSLFIVLQWLFIAWIARTLAARIPKKSV